VAALFKSLKICFFCSLLDSPNLCSKFLYRLVLLTFCPLDRQKSTKNLVTCVFILVLSFPVTLFTIFSSQSLEITLVFFESIFATSKLFTKCEASRFNPVLFKAIKTSQGSVPLLKMIRENQSFVLMWS